MGLHDFRNKMAIIPKNPTLFTGTIRSNLDPGCKKSDHELWNALEQVDLKEDIRSIQGSLDGCVFDGGSNFTNDQRQRIYLARAILRKNKILIVEQMSLNGDFETDKLIQDIIRTKFADCTVLTIAHNIEIVMYSDRILVFKSGKAVEFGQPFKLLQRPGSFLRQLVELMEPMAAATLLGLAENVSYNFMKVLRIHINDKHFYFRTMNPPVHISQNSTRKISNN